MPNGTLVIINPNAGSGRAGRLWAKLEPAMYQHFGDLVVAITQHPEQVAEHLDKAYDAGLTRVVSVGGDGTSYAIVNAMMKLQAQRPTMQPMTFGQLPIGTGQDFARTLRIPNKPEEAIQWLARVPAQPIDLGTVRYGDDESYFLNIASAGVSGKVDEFVHGKKRYPWSFWLASLRAFLTYRPSVVRVSLDGSLWYEGRMWLLTVANGAVFGRGMAIAPNAQVNDGLFDVVLVKDGSRLTMIGAFNSVYAAKHLSRKEVEVKRARHVLVEPIEEPSILLDLDGEPRQSSPQAEISFDLQASALKMLYGGA